MATDFPRPVYRSRHWLQHEHNDIERGSSSQDYHYRQLTNTENDVATGITVPEPAHTRDLVLLPSTVQQASRISSTSTLALDEQTQTRSRKRWSNENAHIDKEPQPKYSCHWMNVLRWEWLSVYRRLNLTVLLINIFILVAFAAKSKLFSLDPNTMATALAANITTAVLFRQEYVVNALFLIFGCCPPWLPLRIKRLAAKIYHFGGVHSGAGIASIIWLAFLDMSLAIQYKRANLGNNDITIVTITIILNLLLCCVVGTSYPTFREKYHNIWELVHRFGGWFAVALFWANFGLLTDEDRKTHRPEETIFEMLVTSATFWMLTVITVCLVAPWLRLRKVPLFSEVQSKYAIRLHFNYTNLPLCAAPRFSKSPLLEWHSFAGIPEESGEGFSVLISGIGDWTKDMVNNPPTELWTRGIPVRGVLHIAPIFRKIVLVATGSGIGPVLSLLYARDIPCRILWCTRDPQITYQPDVIEQVLRADPDAQIITRVRGQKDPDLGKLAFDIHQSSKAEAVFVISNKEGCYNARIWLESRGVVVFTPIFDS